MKKNIETPLRQKFHIFISRIFEHLGSTEITSFFSRTELHRHFFKSDLIKLCNALEIKGRRKEGNKSEGEGVVQNLSK